MSEELGNESGVERITTREEAERAVREDAPFVRRRALEDELAEEFPEYAAWKKKRMYRCLELTAKMLPGDEVDRIMAEEGYHDEKWEPERWRREHTKGKPGER